MPYVGARTGTRQARTRSGRGARSRTRGGGGGGGAVFPVCLVLPPRTDAELSGCPEVEFRHHHHGIGGGRGPYTDVRRVHRCTGLGGVPPGQFGQRSLARTQDDRLRAAVPTETGTDLIGPLEDPYTVHGVVVLVLDREFRVAVEPKGSGPAVDQVQADGAQPHGRVALVGVEAHARLRARSRGGRCLGLWDATYLSHLYARHLGCVPGRLPHGDGALDGPPGPDRLDALFRVVDRASGG